MRIIVTKTSKIRNSKFDVALVRLVVASSLPIASPIFAQEYWSDYFYAKPVPADSRAWSHGQLNALLQTALRDDVPTDLKVAALNDLVIAARKKSYPDALETAVLKFLEGTQAGVGTPAAQLAGMLKLESARKELEDAASNAACGDGTSALRALVCLGGEKTRDFLRDLYAKRCKPKQSWHGSEVIDESDLERVNILCALIDLDATQAAPDVVAHLSRFSEDGHTKIIFEALLSRTGGCAILTRALKDKKLPTEVAKVGIRLATSAGNDANGLIEALKNAGSIK